MMRGSIDPKGGYGPMVDKLVGDAYPHVRAVALELAKIVYLANNLEKLRPQDIDIVSNDAARCIQWKYADETTWQTLVTYSSLLGDDVPGVTKLLQEVRDQVRADATQVAADRVVVTTLTAQTVSNSAAAKASETKAKTSETNSKTSETNAAASASSGSMSAQAAANSASAAQSSQTASKTSETNSKTSETNSKTSETNSKSSETQAKASQTAAAASATSAGSSQTTAAASQANVVAMETNVTNQLALVNTAAANAKTSETNSKASETKAKASENAAKQSAEDAASFRGQAETMENLVLASPVLMTSMPLNSLRTFLPMTAAEELAMKLPKSGRTGPSCWSVQSYGTPTRHIYLATQVFRGVAENLSAILSWHDTAQGDLGWVYHYTTANPPPTKNVGEVFYVMEHITGTWRPNNTGNERYIKLTLNDSFNTGMLSNQTSSGAAPNILATATISLATSPMNGQTIHLENTMSTYRRGSTTSGVVQGDAIRDIQARLTEVIFYGNDQGVATGAFTLGTPNTTNAGMGASNGNRRSVTFSPSAVVPVAIENRPYTLTGVAYMRIL